MEENEVEQKETQPKEDLKLGRLQYKIDYDFNTNNVSKHIPKSWIKTNYFFMSIQLNIYN